MEHEVAVPLPVELVQQALEDSALLARCVPGLSTEAEAPRAAERAAGTGPTEIHGRLKLRVGSSTITYRGVISLIRTGGSGVLTALVEGQEARGDGEVTATVRLAVEADGERATRLRWRGDLTPGGRLAEIDAATLAAAGHRLLDRFAAALAEELADGGSTGDEPAGDEPTAPTLTVVPDLPADGDDTEPLPDDLFAEDLSDLIAFPGSDNEPAEPTAPEEGEPAEGWGRIDVPYGFPRSADEELGPQVPASPEELLGGPVRRSIVGRSAEEVDHAPPRGRYAPALPARSARARAATRWYGDQPAGAAGGHRRLTTPWVIGGGVALLGGAVIVARVLRRR
ncbi:CoxG family protein [Kitasatospora sp. NPDC058965]|uniref:CoxG family protein n=1 Tax=Kitasatospora sp. NPDC058965 TaxID=3346682 RepID=UPI0036CFDB30